MLTLKQQQDLRKDAMLRTPMHDHRDTIETTTTILPFSTEAQAGDDEHEPTPRLARVKNHHCPICMSNDI